jgi:hypothetical protein
VNRPKPILKLLAAAALLSSLSLATASVAQAARPIGAYVRTGASRFVSAPKLAPPKLKRIKRGKGKLAPGYFLIDNFKNLGITKNGKPAPMVGQGGPVIYDSRLRPVWVHGVPDNKYSLNFRSQTYNGKPALSWWEGNLTPTGDVITGEDFVVNQQYKIVAKLVGKDGWTLSQHEFVVTDGHFAFVTAYKNVKMNLSPYGGAAKGMVTDCAVQEYDLNTGKLVYNWDALQHVPLSEAQTKPVPASDKDATKIPWDAYHLNAVQTLPNNEFLASLRSESAAYLVDRSDSHTVWTLGGKHSTFAFGPKATFHWQHDVQLHSDGTVSVFDNECCAFSGTKFLPPSGSTRALVLRLDTAARAATFLAQYSLKHVTAGSQGNTQLLPNGNVMVGFGQQPYFVEYSKSGKILLEARMPDPDSSYRAFVDRWTGKPSTSPSGAALNSGKAATVYASWNGSTNVASWRVLAGHDSGHLKAVATKGRSGFETKIPLKSSYGAYQLEALDRKHQVIKKSRVFSTGKPKTHHAPKGGFY